MKRVDGCGIESATAASGLECRLENNQSERGGGRARTDATTTTESKGKGHCEGERGGARGQQAGQAMRQT